MDTNRSAYELNDFALGQINRKARQLVGKAGSTFDDLEDIKQDMAMDLLERLTKFDPSKSNYKLFVTCVVDRKRRNLMRHRQMAMRDHRREVCSINDEIDVGQDGPVQRLATISQDEQDIRRGKYRRPAEERGHLHLDIEAVLADLPPDLRRAAEMLQSKCVSQVARELRVPRRTFRDKHLAQLREIFYAKGLGEYVPKNLRRQFVAAPGN